MEIFSLYITSDDWSASASAHAGDGLDRLVVVFILVLVRQGHVAKMESLSWYKLSTRGVMKLRHLFSINRLKYVRQLLTLCVPFSRLLVRPSPDVVKYREVPLTPLMIPHVSAPDPDLMVKLPPLRLLSSKPVKVQPFLTETDSMSFLYQ